MRVNTYKNYLLVVLLLLLAFNFVDRLALGLVLEDVKADLGLTDTQLGLLTGIAFALFYSVAGIPIARWADRGNRVSIISLTASLWSVAVALCGIASSFGQLMLIRVGVAVGEAGGVAPGFSLIADYFNRNERPRAVAIYLLGAPMSALLGYLLAGWLNQFYGWRLTFIFLGIPGLILAGVARLTLREPRLKWESHESDDGLRSAVRSTVATPPSLAEVFATLWSNSTFRILLSCISVLFFFTYGILQWQPTYFVRSYGLSTGEIGTWFSVLYGVGGLLGTYLGGELATRYAPRNERLQLVAIAISMCCAAALAGGVYVTTHIYLAFMLIGASHVVTAASNGPLYATIQTLVPDRMRAVAIALVLLIANLIGMGFGPLATGMLSDALRPWAATDSLRYALLALAPGYLLVGTLAWRASRTVARDIESTAIHENVAGRPTEAELLFLGEHRS